MRGFLFATLAVSSRAAHGQAQSAVVPCKARADSEWFTAATSHSLRVADCIIGLQSADGIFLTTLDGSVLDGAIGR